jgi:hypothetical protein
MEKWRANNMAFPLKPEKIAALLGCKNIAAVAANWPLIEGCLAAMPGYCNEVAIAALATVAIETAYTFKPVHEYGDKAYFIKHYFDNERVRIALGNRSAEDAWKYAGRGFIQLTGAANYSTASNSLGVDLVDDPADPSDDADPDKACQPAIAASLFADYFYKRGCYRAARMHEWAKVRKIVNGGTNGLADFLILCAKLEGAINESNA